MMGLWIAEALAITAGTEFIYGVSISEYLKKQAFFGQDSSMKKSPKEQHLLIE